MQCAQITDRRSTAPSPGTPVHTRIRSIVEVPPRRRMRGAGRSGTSPPPLVADVGATTPRAREGERNEVAARDSREVEGTAAAREPNLCVSMRARALGRSRDCGDVIGRRRKNTRSATRAWKIWSLHTSAARLVTRFRARRRGRLRTRARARVERPHPSGVLPEPEPRARRSESAHGWMLFPPFLHLRPHGVIRQQHLPRASKPLPGHRARVPRSKPARDGGALVRVSVHPYHGVLQQRLRDRTQEVLRRAVRVDVHAENSAPISPRLRHRPRRFETFCVSILEISFTRVFVSFVDPPLGDLDARSLRSFERRFRLGPRREAAAPRAHPPRSPTDSPGSTRGSSRRLRLRPRPRPRPRSPSPIPVPVPGLSRTSAKSAGDAGDATKSALDNARRTFAANLSKNASRAATPVPRHGSSARITTPPRDVPRPTRRTRPIERRIDRGGCLRPPRRRRRRARSRTRRSGSVPWATPRARVASRVDFRSPRWRRLRDSNRRRRPVRIPARAPPAATTKPVSAATATIVPAACSPRIAASSASMRRYSNTNISPFTGCRPTRAVMSIAVGDPGGVVARSLCCVTEDASDADVDKRVVGTSPWSRQIRSSMLTRRAWSLEARRR